MTIPDTDLSNLNQDISTWTQASAQPGNDYTELTALITQIKTMLAANPNDPQAISRAYMMFAGPVMIQAMNFQADNLGALGATLNINSDLQAFITDMQNDATFIANNSGTPGTPAVPASGTPGQPGYVPAVPAVLPVAQSPLQATECQNAANDLAQKLCDLANILPNQTPVPGTTPYDFTNSWISQGTDTALVGSLVNVATLLTTNDTDNTVSQTWLASQIQPGTNAGIIDIGNWSNESIASWAMNPTPTPPGQSPSNQTQGGQQMQQLYTYFSQGNNAVSTQNNATQAEIQQQAASFTQFEGITSKGLTEISNLNSAEVKKLSGG